MFDSAESALREVIDRFDPSRLDRSELEVLLRRSETVRRLAGVAHDRVVAAVYEAERAAAPRSGSGASGSSGAAERAAAKKVEKATGRGSRDAKRRVRRSRKLSKAPGVAKKYSSADLPPEKADLLLDAKDAAPTAYARDETYLIRRVEELPLGQARRLVRDWIARHAADQRGDAALAAQRTCSVRRRPDGCSAVSAVLDPKHAAEFTTELDRLTQQLWHLDRRQRPDGGHTRLDQLRADALALMARRSAASDGEGHPTVLACIDATTLGTDQASGADTSTGGGLDATTVGELLCDAEISRVVLGPGDVVLDKGRAVRLATAEQRQALFARWGGCACGCDTPWNQTKIHHIIPWSRGGGSDLENLLPVCYTTHEQIHRGQLVVERAGPDLRLRRRDGTLVTPPPRYRTHRERTPAPVGTAP